MMSKYKLQPGGVLDTENGAHIPENPDNRDWQQYLSWLEEGHLPDTWKTEEELLNEVRKDALQKIDDQAEQERQKVITPGAGQAMTYIRKEQEARAALLDTSLDPSSYPILRASIAAELAIGIEAVTSVDLQSIARVVIQLSDAWAMRASQIEEIRLSAKREVNNAASAEFIYAITAGLDWSS
jgi:hypothetical protein